VRLRGLRPTRAEAGAATASALLFALVFPPFPLLIPAFVCLVPLAVLVARRADGDGRTRQAARAGFWFGLLGYGFNLYWIAVALSLFTKLAIAGYIASLLWLAPFIGATAAALFAARRLTRWPLALLLPIVWTTSELLLNYLGDLAFPWLPLGLSLAAHPVAVQLADLSGVRTVSFWIAATNGLIADAWLLRRQAGAVVRRAAAVVAIAALVLGYGAWRMQTTVLVPLAAIAIVQPNIPEDQKLQATDKESFVGALAGGTRQALRAADPALVVWPETALPGYIDQHPSWRDTLRTLATIERTPILFGVIDYEWRDAAHYDFYNAAMLTDSVGSLGAQPAYHKGFLVPIVERVPFVNPAWFEGLQYFGAFGRGGDQPPMRLPFGRVGVLICYESIFPQLSRRFRRDGADVLLNITNDAWFGRSNAPYQHHAHLILRAIENRVGIVRSANTGISGYIDPLGRVHDETPLFVPAARTYMAQTTHVRTLYVRVGDWLGILSALATALMIAGELRRRRLARRETAAG
jgi:apolipoprotein N-acyltransferase